LTGAVSLAGWWRGEPPSRDALRQLRGTEVWAAAGIASPQRFFDMLRAEGLRVREIALADNHRFDVLPWPADGATVLVTEKDAVKLRPVAAGTTAVWVLRLDLTLPPGLVASLLSHLPKPP
jgi:tetraacyldisaccharide 4'-kinase